MTLKEFYEKTNGSYDDVMSRLLTEERVKKFILKFADSKEYSNLMAALEANDTEASFRTSHTLKGMCLNLAFSQLAASSSALCEEYRNGAPSGDVTPLISKVTEDYNYLMASIRDL